MVFRSSVVVVVVEENSETSWRLFCVDPARTKNAAFCKGLGTKTAEEKLVAGEENDAVSAKRAAGANRRRVVITVMVVVRQLPILLGWSLANL